MTALPGWRAAGPALPLIHCPLRLGVFIILHALGVKYEFVRGHDGALSHTYRAPR